MRIKKQFTRQEVILSSGCYSNRQIMKLGFIKKGAEYRNKPIKLEDILKSKIELEDKIWFLYKRCNLDLDTKIELSTKLAEIVNPLRNNATRVAHWPAYHAANAAHYAADVAHYATNAAHCAANSAARAATEDFTDRTYYDLILEELMNLIK